MFSVKHPSWSLAYRRYSIFQLDPSPRNESSAVPETGLSAGNAEVEKRQWTSSRDKQGNDSQQFGIAVSTSAHTGRGGGPWR